MFVGITLERDNGQEARIRFPDASEGGALVHCEASMGCVHELGPEQVATLFAALGIPYNGNGLDGVRALIAQDKAQVLLDMIHQEPSAEDPSADALGCIVVDPEPLKEALELYLTGFSLAMLARHFYVAPTQVVRWLALAVFDEDQLEEDSSKDRHQMTWDRYELRFLASQMQLGRTPTEISALMGRDALGIAFKLFTSFPVPIPKHVQEQFGVSVRTEPMGEIPSQQPRS